MTGGDSGGHIGDIDRDRLTGGGCAIVNLNGQRKASGTFIINRRGIINRNVARSIDGKGITAIAADDVKCRGDIACGNH